MSRGADCARKFKYYHDELYQVAYEGALEGQTTKWEAGRVAEEQAGIEAFRIMCRTSLYFLATEVFQMHTARIGGRLIWDEDIHGLLCDLLQGDDDTHILMSRHMLKTTVAAMWIVQLIAKEPASVRACIWAQSIGRAVAIGKTIKTMVQHPKLLKAFPDRFLPRKRWARDSDEYFTITRDVADDEGTKREFAANEEQVELAGLNTNVVGRHPTHQLLDDIITDKNTTTAVQLEKAIDNYSTISGLKGIDTIEKLIGTPYHPLDLHHYIIDNDLIPASGRIRIAGVHMAGAREVIDYKWYTKEFLRKQKKKMRHMYWPQIHLDTRPREDRMFTPPYPEWIEWPEEATEFYFGIDPATGLGRDKSAIAVGAVDPINTTGVWLAEVETYDVEGERLAEIIVEKIVRYAPKRVGIELGQQAALLPLIRLKAQEYEKIHGYFPMPQFFEVSTGGGAYGRSKFQKIDGTFGVMLRDKRVFLNTAMLTLKFQMEAFDKHKQKNDDDALDATGILIRSVPYFSYGYTIADDGLPVSRRPTWKALSQMNTKPKSERDRLFAN